MKKQKVALVLEGGGLRGAYTAGALSWLIDNNIEFDSAYGISTGAIHLVNYLMKNKKYLFDIAIDYIKNKKAMFLPALIRCGRIVDYDYLFGELLLNGISYDYSSLKDVKTKGYIGVYDLNEAKTVFLPVQEISLHELKAACSLPIIGKVVENNGRRMLDGGITEMIPINQSINDGNTAHLIITTKPDGYRKKPAKGIVVKVMKLLYKDCPTIGDDYAVRHINYEKQVMHIEQVQKDNCGVYVCPSRKSKVTRLSGSREDLIDLFNLGYQDMENRKTEILALFK